ncbi:hypothetical protein PFISCL1PPCAC_18419, partial [Pristionchus fissidentatus]
YEYIFLQVSKVVFVTYSSSNHFSEARKGIKSMRTLFQNKIVFYDLGLWDSQVEELAKVCNLEVRKFEFERFPDFVSELRGYNFKPIIMAEVFREFEHFWIIDASIRFFDIDPFLYEFYANFPNCGSHCLFNGFYLNVHPRFKLVSKDKTITFLAEMYNYLPMNFTLAKSLEMLSATMFIARSNFSREAVKWNVLCALTSDCMAPRESRVYCSFDKDRNGKYANCHRYDQSSINIIVSSLLERDGWKRRDRVNDDPVANFSSVEREDRDEIPLSIPCQ